MALTDACRGCCENAPHAMLIADMDGRIIWANAAAARFSGGIFPLTCSANRSYRFSFLPG